MIINNRELIIRKTYTWKHIVAKIDDCIALGGNHSSDVLRKAAGGTHHSELVQRLDNDLTELLLLVRLLVPLQLTESRHILHAHLPGTSLLGSSLLKGSLRQVCQYLVRLCACHTDTAILIHY